jgi:thymidine phosphorylase
MLAQEIIRLKRNGLALERSHIDAFVQGLVDSSWSDAQVASMAMAIYLNGMTLDEVVALTRAMTHSGDLLDWASAGLDGPVLDKHSTGGVGDKVSLALAPIVAACGGYVPMISGRALGHTGGTLDKLQSIPGYDCAPSAEVFRRTVRTAGCAIVGQTARLAPADRRLYAVRDVTATIESVPLITASILSKKLAAGLQGLVMDVKTGNGAFAAERHQADALAQSLATVASGAGLPIRVWITDMNQVLGRACGNALEVLEAIDLLRGKSGEPRLLEVTRMFGAEMLVLGGVAHRIEEGLVKVDAAISSGRALERFARMVVELGGPSDFTEKPGRHLPEAPVRRAATATQGGWVSQISTRDIGLLLIELGGGRRQASDVVDPSVGFTEVASVGQRVEAGDVLAYVHARSEPDAELAQRKLGELIGVTENPVARTPVMLERSEPSRR